MSQRAFASSLPAIWAVVITAAFGIGFRSIPWPFIDLYNNLYRATSLSWLDTLSFAFAAGVEYRPLLTILIKLAHWLVGLRLWAYQILVLLQFAAILALLIRLFRPAGTGRGIAACLALTCVAGLHTSRVLFMFAPLNAHSLGVVLLLAAAVLALEPRARSLQWMFFPLTLAALLLLESGLLVVAVLVVLRVSKALSPAATGDHMSLTWRGVAASVAALTVYLVLRFTFTSDAAAPSAYTQTGLGFTDGVEPERLAAIFGEAPWLLWLYNVAATFLTVVLSEPRSGRFRLIETLIDGDTPRWLTIHVWSSLLTSALVVVALALWRPLTARDRFVAAIGATLLVVGSGLGFLYTRDRIALSAGVGYGMLVYVGVSAWLERLVPRGRPASPALRTLARALAVAVVAAIGAGWAIRAVEARFQLRDTAWENYLEWTDRYESLAGARTRTDILVMLRESVVARRPPDPGTDPAWTYRWFERFESGPTLADADR